MNGKIIEYIRKNLKAGYSKEAIMHALLKAGYNINTAEEHIGHALSLKPEKHFVRDITQEIASNSDKYLVAALAAMLLITVLVLSFNYFTDIEEKDITSVRTFYRYDKNESLNLLNKALISNDAAICGEIGDERLKNECRNIFAHNESICDEKCENAKILNLAIINNNESLCMGIINESLRNNCLDNFKGVKKTAEQACGKECKDKQALNLALIKRNESICLQINDSLMKEQCEKMLEKEVDEE